MTTLRHLWLPLAAAFRLDRRAALLAFLEVLGAILSNLLPLAFGLMVTGVVTRSESTLVVGAALAAVGFGVVPVFTTIGVEARLRLNESVGHEFDRRVAELMAAVPTLDHLESPAFRDQAQIVRERQGALGGAYNSMVNALRNLTMPVVALAVAIGADARLLWLLPASLPSLLLGRWLVRWDRQAEDDGAEPGRLTQHLVSLAMEPDPASELRVLGARAVRGAQAAHRRRRLATSARARRRAQEPRSHGLRPVLPRRRGSGPDTDRPGRRRRSRAGRCRRDLGARDRPAPERRLVAAVQLPDARAGRPNRRPLPDAGGRRRRRSGQRGHRHAAGDVAVGPRDARTGLHAIPVRTHRRWSTSTWTSRPARWWRSSARTAPGSRPSSSSSPASTDPPWVRSWSTGST